jgi:steroid delta-isomerase-like uncharacterized protein
MSSESRTDLETVYLAYLDVLNERRFGDLDGFVHDELTYNDKVLTRQEYADMIAADVRATPDLRFTAQQLVAGDDLVACRLWFECTPTGTFLGVPPNGQRISFAEHAFYSFRAGRIAAVWSLIDHDAVREQLAR